MPEGILIEPLIHGKEHGAAIQAELFPFALKVTNKQNTPSHEFNISQIVLKSAEGQNIAEDFGGKSFLVGRLNPEESRVIDIGKCGSYMHGIAYVSAMTQSTDPVITLNLLQKNQFTGEIVNIGTNRWLDFIHIRNSNEYKQEKATMGMMWLSIVVAIFTLLQIISIFLIEPRKQSEAIIRKVNEADNLNLFVACQTKFVFKQEDKNFLVNYEVQIYKENFDTLNKQPPSTKQAIRDNIVLMEASNKMMNLLFEQPQKRNEFGPKLISNADQIIKNLDVYNEQIIEGECNN